MSKTLIKGVFFLINCTHGTVLDDPIECYVDANKPLVIAEFFYKYYPVDKFKKLCYKMLALIPKDYQ